MEDQNVKNNVETVEQNQEEKKFTQEEVNRIVQDRLKREKAKQEKMQDQEGPENSEATDEQEASVAMRESRVECREFIADKGYKRELLEILDTSDAEKFKSQAEQLAELYTGQKETKIYPGVKPNPTNYQARKNLSFAKTKHVPKQY